MTWSKIQKTALATIAKAKILDNAAQYGLKYHNWKHVSVMYKYLHDTNEPYDEALDWAVHFHDIVYDDQPKKEYRSAVMFSDMKGKIMSTDFFGDRMKAYEKEFTSAYVSTDQILCVRIDGKGFSKFTKGFKKPFDDRLSNVMIQTTKKLCAETHASFSYTQSDEITLIYTPGEKASEYIFGGKVSKINSILASMATYYFNYDLAACVKVDKPAFFDCRAWSVPDLTEASNVLLWRVQDAKKNSTSALFRWTAGHKAMDKLDQAGMKKYLLEKHSVDWNDLPNRWKYGSYAKPVTIESYLTEAELAHIPEAKRPKDLLVKRTKIQEIDIGYFGDLSLEQRINFIK